MTDGQVSGSHRRVQPMLWAALGVGIITIMHGLAESHAKPQGETRLGSRQAPALSTGTNLHYLVSNDTTLRGALRMPDATFSLNELDRAAAANSHLKAFLERFEVLKTGEAPSSALTAGEWLRPDGPWGPYLSRPFADGLAPADRERRRVALKANDCRTVETLARKGFARLYPDIGPAVALKRPFRSGLLFDPPPAAAKVDTDFRARVLPARSLDYKRCTAIGRLHRARTWAARQNVKLGVLDTNRLRSDRKDEQPAARDGHLYETMRCIAIRTLAWLAVSRDFGPAIRDLLVFSERSGFLVLTPEAEFYYLSRALHMGLDVQALKIRYMQRRQALSADTLKVLYEAVYRPDRAARVLPRWKCPLNFSRPR